MPLHILLALTALLAPVMSPCQCDTRSRADAAPSQAISQCGHPCGGHDQGPEENDEQPTRPGQHCPGGDMPCRHNLMPGTVPFMVTTPPLTVDIGSSVSIAVTAFPVGVPAGTVLKSPLDNQPPPIGLIVVRTRFLRI
jgi:hypothetical protein